MPQRFYEQICECISNFVKLCPESNFHLQRIGQKQELKLNVLIPFLVSIPTPAKIIRRDLSEIWERKKLTIKSTHIPLPCLPQKKKNTGNQLLIGDNLCG